MVAAKERKATLEQEEERARLEGLDSEQEEEQESKEPTYWKDATPVRIHSISLTPELFDGTVEYRSKGSKSNPDGLITVLDEDFAKYKIGMLLQPIADRIQALSESGELSDYILGSIDFSIEVQEEKEKAQREAKREEILAVASKKYNRMKDFLIAANPEMRKWSKEKTIAWIADNMN